MPLPMAVLGALLLSALFGTPAELRRKMSLHMRR